MSTPTGSLVVRIAACNSAPTGSGTASSAVGCLHSLHRKFEAVAIVWALITSGLAGLNRADVQGRAVQNRYVPDFVAEREQPPSADDLQEAWCHPEAKPSRPFWVGVAAESWIHHRYLVNADEIGQLSFKIGQWLG